MADSTGSVKPRAVATLRPQSNMQGVWGESGSGLAPDDELQLVAQSFSWLQGQRFPTRVPIDQLRELAQDENRRLTAPEVVVLTAAEFLDRREKPETFRQLLRQQRLALKAIKLILQAERANQVIDHLEADVEE
jgi:hypothetical protein